MSKVWFITSIRIDTDKGHIYKDDIREKYGLDEQLSCRTVGFFMTREDAIKALELNLGDLNESGWYPWVCIEGLCSDEIYPLLEKEEDQLFFEWVGQAGSPEFKALSQSYLR